MWVLCLPRSSELAGLESPAWLAKDTNLGLCTQRAGQQLTQADRSPARPRQGPTGGRREMETLGGFQDIACPGVRAD